MKKSRIAVLGASGFVGSALCERLFFDGGFDFVALVRSTGNVGRITRLPVEVRTVDILDAGQVMKSIGDCGVVVNCTRGEDFVMLKGLRNVIRAALKLDMKKFVHLSSAAIYGENPPLSAHEESGIPEPGKNKYGIIKLKQDKMVFQLYQRGVPSVILCPSNIYGPYSLFVLGAVKSIRENSVVLVEEGKNPTNLVHIDNLVEAIICCIRSNEGFGERYFVNEVKQTTWKEFYTDLKRILGLDYEFRYVSRREIIDALGQTPGRISFFDNLRIMLSGEFRECLSMIPAIKKANNAMYSLFNSLRPSIQKWFRNRVERPEIIDKETNGQPLSLQFNKVQLRSVYHSPKKIIKTLNYRPVLSYGEGLRSVSEWLKFFNIIS